MLTICTRGQPRPSGKRLPSAALSRPSRWRWPPAPPRHSPRRHPTARPTAQPPRPPQQPSGRPRRATFTPSPDRRRGLLQHPDGQTALRARRLFRAGHHQPRPRHLPPGRRLCRMGALWRGPRRRQILGSQLVRIETMGSYIAATWQAPTTAPATPPAAPSTCQALCWPMGRRSPCWARERRDAAGARVLRVITPVPVAVRDGSGAGLQCGSSQPLHLEAVDSHFCR
jgi:hypothetical protein